jgi:MFS family permease
LFIGVVIGCLILPRLADIIGRKPIFLVGLFLIMINTAGLSVCTNLTLAYFILFIGGVGTTGTCFVGFIYSVEIIPKEN